MAKHLLVALYLTGDASSNEGTLQRSQIPVNQQQPNQRQTIEIVTSSSGSANAVRQQPANESSSSLIGQSTQSQQASRGTDQTVYSQQRRGIQRRPITWDSASSSQQNTLSTQSNVPIAPRGMHGARGLRGPRSGRRAGRGIYGPGRGLPRGGAS